MIFLGSYYLVNLILAVVASSYEEQRKSVKTALEDEKRAFESQKASMTKYNDDYEKLKARKLLETDSKCCLI